MTISKSKARKDEVTARVLVSETIKDLLTDPLLLLLHLKISGGEDCRLGRALAFIFFTPLSF